MNRTGNTWWSSRFLRSLERLGLVNRGLHHKEIIGRDGVLSLTVRVGGFEAVVWDMEREYSCVVEFEPLSDLEWKESFERLAFQDLSAAALLTTGRLPLQIEDFFLPSGRRLLPQQGTELEFQCQCPSRERVCPHLAAAAYLFAERLDRDPWLLFLVRGRSSEAVKAALAKRWNRDYLAPEDGQLAGTEEVVVSELPEDIDLFWNGPAPGNIPLPPPAGRPGLTAKRLATPEPKVDPKAWNDLLTDIYATISKRAKSRLET